MDKAVEHVQNQFATVRTGRAAPALVERLLVDYYGAPVPLQQLASIQVPEARTLVVKPHDRGRAGADREGDPRQRPRRVAQQRRRRDPPQLPPAHRGAPPRVREGRQAHGGGRPRSPSATSGATPASTSRRPRRTARSPRTTSTAPRRSSRRSPTTTSSGSTRRSAARKPNCSRSSRSDTAAGWGPAARHDRAAGDDRERTQDERRHVARAPGPRRFQRVRLAVRRRRADPEHRRGAPGSDGSAGAKAPSAPRRAGRAR